MTLEADALARLHVSQPERQPISYGAVDPPICTECQELDLSFFDPTCLGCLEILTDPQTTIGQIFAIIRQWVPQTQQNIDSLVSEMLKRGIHVNDRDGLTDMTMLHYVAKSGASGVGDMKTSCNVLKMLLSNGSNLTTKCRWTDMTALHYAVFFDNMPMVEMILEASERPSIDQSCKEFDNGTALHIACSNLSFQSVPVLIKYGANPHYPNKHGKIPIKCIPSADVIGEDKTALRIAIESIELALKEAMEKTEPSRIRHLNNATLQALGLDLYDKVYVAGKVGVLKFCGSTEFASGQWAGIELTEPVGKNDGSINGVRYFKCKPKYGIFAPLTRVTKYAADILPAWPITQYLNSSEPARSRTKQSLNLGEKVIVAGQKTGFVRYLGPTKFANGIWAGVELDQAAGKNDGTVAGVRYFICKPKHGVFAPQSKVRRISDDMHDRSADVTQPNTTDLTKKNGKKSETVKQKFTEKELHSRLKGVNISPTSHRKKDASSHSPDETFGSRVNFTLKNGMSVYVNNELGVVKYIGNVEFSDGVWLGIELRKPNGKNDGTVEGRRYFSCKMKHGLMVRPNRATCRGINCSQLVDTSTC